MYTVYKCLGFLFLGRNAYCRGNSLVGKEHEFLDELVGILGFLEEHRCGMSVLINIEAYLNAVKFYRTIVVAFLA